jgi:cysteinyl-tRNA synthetase
MTLRIYNTISRAKEEFKPVQAGKVNIYVCGPTVYDYIHIGNARPMIFFDVVRKYLLALGYKVQYVVNFTDVDDKLIRKAEQMELSVPEVADRFIRAYYDDAKALGVLEADVHPRVTEHISEIVDFIGGLMEKGFAYESEGDVYFRTSEFKDYGKLSQQNLEELQYGIRIEVDERKENARDFVLWKKAKPGEISWSSPWGEGRPGWHIECSAMAAQYLGETLDIHGGGVDLQFPHHECELAQSEALHQRPLAKYWMHNGYIHINNEKMSKSLGNGVNVSQLLKTVKAQALRFFMMSAHYRGPLNFSSETMKQAESSLERIENCISNVRHRMNGALDGEEDIAVKGQIDSCRRQFHEKMRDDFNTPDAITAMFDLVSAANLYMQREQVSKTSLEAIVQLFKEMDGILGILVEEADELLDEQIERLIQERTEARSNKNWARADEIRDLLTEKGIYLEDTPQGIRWRRK